jgi:hypothetical protein
MHESCSVLCIVGVHSRQSSTCQSTHNPNASASQLLLAKAYPSLPKHILLGHVGGHLPALKGDSVQHVLDVTAVDVVRADVAGGLLCAEVAALASTRVESVVPLDGDAVQAQAGRPGEVTVVGDAGPMRVPRRETLLVRVLLSVV